MFILKSTIKDVFRHFMRSSILILIIAILSTASAAIYAISLDLNAAAKELETNQSINVYLKKGTPWSNVQLIQDQIAKMPNVVKTGYVNPSVGLDILVEKYPQFEDVIRDIGENPIQPLIKVRLTDLSYSKIITPLIKEIPNVESVEYDEDALQGLININNFIKIFMYYLIGITILLFVSSFILLAMTIINEKRREIAIMTIIASTPSQIFSLTPLHLFVLWFAGTGVFVAMLNPLLKLLNTALQTYFPWLLSSQNNVATFTAIAPVIATSSFLLILLASIISIGVAGRIGNNKNLLSTLAER